ncbi:helix-turn-helix domain-containing protein [bacterium SCSIO 12643]|nr:helix-turn-helix domain-containing protein [bacterium SCSIO 12643]
MSRKDQVTFYEANKLGKGLPFAIVSHAELISSNDLFTPSLRDFHVIFWFKKGTGKYYIDFEEYEIKPNTILLTSKDNLHYFEHFKDFCELQSIAFQPNFVYRNNKDLRHLFNFDAACHFTGRQTLSPNESDTQFLENISNQMFEIFGNWDGVAREEGFYHALSLFLIRCEQIQQETKGGDTRNMVYSEMLLKFNELLSHNFKTETKVEFYVEQLGTTVKTLSRLVKEQYNVSTKAVIDERRTLEIKRMLRGTNKPVKEIAYELGFDEPTNMIKYFKKHVGMTPNGFRKSFV